MKTETKTEHVHEITVVPEDEPFTFTGRDDEQISSTLLVVSIKTHDDGTVRPIQTTFRARGVALNKDGKPGRSQRRFEGGNLNRLPADVREVVLAEADRLGVKGLREDVANTGVSARAGSASEE